jgi:phosphate/sulfate permease
MKFFAVIGALIGGCLGAALWAAIVYYFHVQIGIVAWVVGAAVGLGAAVAGGRGATSGIVCALIAVAAIFAGKMAAVHFMVYKMIDTSIAELDTAEYQEFQKDAADFNNVKDDNFAEFMVTHQYTDATTSSEVLEEEIRDFKKDSMPLLVRQTQTPLSIDQYRDSFRKEFEKTYSQNISLTDIVVENLGVLDVLFILLGIGSAYKIGSQSDD